MSQDCERPSIKKIPTNLSLREQTELLLHPALNPTGYVPFECARNWQFEPKATTWSRVNAWWLADASWTAYSHDEADVTRLFHDSANLPHCVPIANKGTACYLAYGDEFAIVSFRGTEWDDWDNIFDIARFEPIAWDVGYVDGGFADALEAVWTLLEQALNGLPDGCRVWFTGHSLGAALATLAAYRHRDRTAGCYTMASPLVGNGAFAAAYDTVFEERSIRYVNDHDAVTHVPPGRFALPHGLYTHVDHLRWINKDGQVSTTQPTLLHFVEDVFGRTNVLLDFIRHLGNGADLEPPAALSDHTPLFYALHCWNDFVVHR